MERLIEQVNKVIPEIIGWVKTIYIQLTGFVIDANTKVDIAKQSLWQMIITPGWHTLFEIAALIAIYRLGLKKLFKKR